MGEVGPVRREQIQARLTEIDTELRAILAELGGDGRADTPEQRRRAFRVYDGGAAVTGG